MKPTLTQILEALQIGEELFWEPTRLVRPGAWTGHLATAFWLTKAVAPRVFVELGTHSGNSYSAFCQAISSLGLPARAFAVDSWHGDEHSGLYDDSVFDDLFNFNQDHYSGFSKLLRTSFDDARQYFPENSIDLLHLDGLHTYDAIKHDFDHWKAALSERAVVVIHDTNVREREFGVWKLWKELSAEYPSFEFIHSEGLGVLGYGRNQSSTISRLFEMGSDPDSASLARRIFAGRGDVFSNRSSVLDLQTHSEYLASELQKRAEYVSAVELDSNRKSGQINQLQHELVVRDTAATASATRNAEERRLQGEALSRAQMEIELKSEMVAERTEVIRAKSELMERLRNELAASNANVRSHSAEIERMAKLLEQQEDLLTSRQAELSALSNTNSSLREQLDSVRAQLAQTQTRLGAIENSSTWKLASKASSAFHHFPRARRFLMRTASFLWWTVSLQLFAKLRERRQLFQLRDKIAASSWFDAQWYMATYPDVAQAGEDPALHYALHGAVEPRSPGPRFDAEAYRRQNPDVAQAGMNPLIHYLDHGAAEGRTVTSVGAGCVTRLDYESWLQSYDTLNDADRIAIKRHIRTLAQQPLISVVMPVYDTRPEFLHSDLDSVLAQIYPYWELCIADDASPNPEVRAILDDYARRDRRIELVYFVLDSWRRR